MGKCKMCNSEIESKAKLCNHCGSDQRILYRFIKETGLINIVSIVVLLLSFTQYNNAKREKKLAESANNSAQIALHKTDSISAYIEKLTKLNAEIAYITTHKYTILASGSIIYPETFTIRMDSLMRIIEPDSVKRKELIEKLN